MGICTLLFGIHPFPTVEHPPMEYEASTSIKTSNAVTVKEITDFFVDYIKMSSVSSIANAHAAWADLAADGVLDNYCLQLAKLHSTAVDFAKSSIPAVMPAHLKPYETPDWLRCFSRRKYKSSSILGQLHSRIQEIIKDNLQMERDTCGDNLYEVDPSLLIEGHQEFETEAEYIFAEYAGEVWKIMRDFDVPQEVQMLSGFISTYLNSVSKTREHASTAQRLNQAVLEVQSKYKSIFYDNIDSASQARRLCKASAWYKVAYSHASRSAVAFRSFGWIAVDLMSELLKNSRSSVDQNQKTEQPADQQHVGKLYDAAKKYLIQNEHARCLTNLEELLAQKTLALSPDLKFSIFLDMAQCHIALGEYSQALYFCKQGLKDPSSQARASVLMRDASSKQLLECDKRHAFDYEKAFELTRGIILKIALDDKLSPEKRETAFNNLKLLPFTRKLQCLEDIRVVGPNDDITITPNKLTIFVLLKGRYSQSVQIFGKFQQSAMFIASDRNVIFQNNPQQHTLFVEDAFCLVSGILFVSLPNVPLTQSAICCCSNSNDLESLATACLFLFDCTIYKHREVGLLICDPGAEALLFRCKIDSCSKQAIEVRRGGSVHLSEVTIEDCLQGVCAYAGAKRIVVVNSHIKNCQKEGILAKGSDLTAQMQAKQKIINQYSGLAETMNKARTFSEKIKQSVAGKGVELDACVRDSIIEDCKMIGISLDGAIVNASIEGCTLRNNVKGVFIKGGISARISACHIYHHQMQGITIEENCNSSVHVRNCCFVGTTTKAFYAQNPGLGDLRIGFVESKPVIQEGNLIGISNNSTIDGMTDLKLRCIKLNRLKDRGDAHKPPFTLMDTSRWSRQVVRHESGQVYYYAIGNIRSFPITSSLQSFENVPRLDILLANVRDIRLIVQICSHLTSLNQQEGASTTIVCQEETNANLARIIVLLSMIEDGAGSNDVVAIWANVALNAAQHKILTNKLAKFAGGEFPRWMRLASTKVLTSLRQIFQEWSTCSISLKEVEHTRSKEYNATNKAALHIMLALLELDLQTVTSSRVELINMLNDLDKYGRLGTLPQGKKQAEYLNVTMLDASYLFVPLYYSSSILRVLNLDPIVRELSTRKKPKSGDVFQWICQIVEPQFQATKKWFENANNAVGFVGDSVHQFSFGIPTLFSLHDADPGIAPCGFDFIDFSNLSDYDSVSCFLLHGVSLMKPVEHSRFFLHSLRYNRVISKSALNNLANNCESYLLQTVGMDSKTIQNILNIKLKTHSVINNVLSMEWQLATVNNIDQSKLNITTKVQMSYFNFMADRFLSIPWLQAYDYRSELQGSGSTAFLRVLQLSHPSLPLNSVLDSLYTVNKNNKALSLHETELYSLATIQNYQSSCPINEVVLLSFQVEINPLIYMVGECVLQLFITKTLHSHDGTLQESDIVQIYDSFSFDFTSSEIQVLMLECYRQKWESFYFTLHAYKLSMVGTESRFVVAESIPIKKMTQQGEFTMNKWLAPVYTKQVNQIVDLTPISIKPSWIGLKNMGNNHFKEANYKAAIAHYSRALSSEDDIFLQVVLHLSLCYFELKQFNKCLQYSLVSLAIDRSCFISWILIGEIVAQSEENLAAWFLKEGTQRIEKGHRLASVFALYPFAQSFRPLISINNNHPADEFDFSVIAQVILSSLSSALTPIQLCQYSMSECLHAKVQAVECVRNKDIESAVSLFRIAFAQLAERGALLSNLATCHSKLNGRFDSTQFLLEATAAHIVDSRNGRAIIRKAQALLGLGHLDAALQCCDEAVNNCENLSPPLKNELQSLIDKIQNFDRPNPTIIDVDGEAGKKKLVNTFTKVVEASGEALVSELAAIPRFNTEIDRFPLYANRQLCQTALDNAYSQSKWYRFEASISEASNFVKPENIVHRLGCTLPARMNWWRTGLVSSVRFFAEDVNLTTNPTNFLSFSTQPVSPMILTPGSVHVAIGAQHMDLTTICVSDWAPEMLSDTPLRFVGFGPNAQCVAKSLIIAQMSRSTKASQSDIITAILELWYSSTLHPNTVAISLAAISDLLTCSSDLDASVAALLQHWQTAKVSLPAARDHWFQRLPRLEMAANLKRKEDRIAFCKYALTSELVPADKHCLGNFTMFDVPGLTRVAPETVFDRLQLHELSANISTSCTIVEAAVCRLTGEIHRLVDYVKSGRVTIEFRLGCLSSNPLATVDAISDLQAQSIYWFNTPDYFQPKKFHFLAREASSTNSVHTASSLSWLRDVKGTWIYDYGEAAYVVNLIHKSRNYFPFGKELESYFVLPSVDNVMNTSSFILAPQFKNAWHSEFFHQSRACFDVLDNVQSPADSLHTTVYCPLSSRLCQLTFSFSYIQPEVEHANVEIENVNSPIDPRNNNNVPVLLTPIPQRNNADSNSFQDLKQRNTRPSERERNNKMCPGEDIEGGAINSDL